MSRFSNIPCPTNLLHIQCKLGGLFMSLIWADRRQEIGGERINEINEQKRKNRSKQWDLCREQLVKEAGEVLFVNKNRAKRGAVI